MYYKLCIINVLNVIYMYVCRTDVFFSAAMIIEEKTIRLLKYVRNFKIKPIENMELFRAT